MVDLKPWDASEFLTSEESIIEYLNAAMETGDPAFIQSAIGDVVKARGMTNVAREAGVGRQSLYKSLSRDGNPSFQTVSKVIAALGGRLAVRPA